MAVLETKGKNTKTDKSHSFPLHIYYIHSGAADIEVECGSVITMRSWSSRPSLFRFVRRASIPLRRTLMRKVVLCATTRTEQGNGGEGGEKRKWNE